VAPVGHGHTHAANERRTLWATVITAAFMVAEAVGGWLAGSLALVADAAHMLTDAVSLGLAWFAFRLSRRPPTLAHTFGYDRLQVVVAFANGITMLFLVGWIVVHAFERLAQPTPILPVPMIAIAALGLAVNVGVFATLHGADRANLNIRGAMLHVMGDLLGSVAALTAGVVIFLTGWVQIDAWLSLVVAALLIRSAIALVRDSGRILLQAVPQGLDVETILADLKSLPDVEDVHHLHAWCLTHEQHIATLHARVAVGADRDDAVHRIKRRLVDRFGIGHATVEVEVQSCADEKLPDYRPEADATAPHPHPEVSAGPSKGAA
jgi:cobalt-zinc-cadmium efflux system protein